jgi:hypothetical protein
LEEKMADADAAQSVVKPNEELAAKERVLDLRLKELEVADKEYEQKHRPSRLFSVAGNPAVIAAMIAGWVTLSAGLITWQSGRITAEQQNEAANFQREADERKFEANLITEAVKAKDADQAATNLKFLVDTGLLKGELRLRSMTYLQNRQPGDDGKVTLPH